MKDNFTRADIINALVDSFQGGLFTNKEMESLTTSLDFDHALVCDYSASLRK